MLKILLADDHEVVRAGVRRMLEAHQGWTVCGEARTGVEAIMKAIELRPQVVVLDLEMPEANGLEATREIKKRLPEAEVLVYSVHETDHFVREAVFAGAHGYVCKSDAGSHLICAIEALIKHKFFFATRRSDDPYDAEFLPSAEPALPVVLTHRENQIVQYLTEGSTNREVASRLGISVKTVETHRTTVMRKLGVHSIVKLVHYAVRNNICSYGTARLQSENLKKMRRLGNSSFAASS